MKHFFTTALLSCAAICGSAQQINGDFSTWEDCIPWTSKGNTRAQGTQPQGWTISNVIGINGLGAVTVGSQATDENRTIVELINTPNPFKSDQIVPAYITLGTTWATSTGSSTITNKDGGTFGGINFTNLPDSIKLRYKRTYAQTNSNERASVIAYLWKGTWTQKAVPGNIVLFGKPNIVDMVNRERNILGIKTDQGGAISHTANAERIGSIIKSIEGEHTEWTNLSIPFKYNSTNRPEMLNIIISANDYFEPVAISGNTISIGDVELIYNSSLSDLKYNGQTISKFNKDVYTYEIKETYTEGCLTAIKDCVGGSTNITYNGDTGIATIMVKGDDWSESNPNEHKYTIQFAKPHANGTGKLLSLEVNGHSVSNFTSDNLYYTIVGEYTEKGITYTAEDGEDATVVVDYNSENRIATITVKANYGDATSTYKVKFAKPTTNYVGKMLISMANSFLAAGNDPVGITSPNNGSVDFQLLNFQLEGMGLIGDIFITDVPYAPNAKGDVTLHKEQEIVIFGAAGESLGTLPVTLNAEVINGQLKGKIDIIWEGLPIVVDIYPFSTTFMDIPAIGANNYMDAIKQNMTNKNLLIYLTEEVNNMDNIIVNDQCANLVLTDGYAFNAPKEFTATSVSYNRQFKTGNLSSFVMPFSMNTNDINGKVYQLTGIEGDVLQFETVNGTTEANQPYIIDMNGTNLFNKVANATVKAATTLDNVKGNATHIGSFTKQQIVSDAITSYYGYTNGNFVKANTGTLNPFRTAIKVTGITAQALALSLDGNITGIGCITNDTLNLNAEVNVYDINGRIVRKNINAATALQGLPNGVYVVNGKKIIKK